MVTEEQLTAARDAAITCVGHLRCGSPRGSFWDLCKLDPTDENVLKAYEGWVEHHCEKLAEYACQGRAALTEEVRGSIQVGNAKAGRSPSVTIGYDK